MDDQRSRFDIILCAGERQFPELKRLLPRLHPFGRVHVASSYLRPEQIAAVRQWVDQMHYPQHDSDGYENFRLFCIRDINRIASAPHFIKLDTDVQLADDWIDYVEESLASRPDAVLIGTHAGSNRIDYDISGTLVRRRLKGDLRVRGGLKVNGSFYIGDTAFFKEHDRSMQLLHDLVYAFRDGRRVRPPHLPLDPGEQALGAEGLVRMRGVCALRQGKASEDNLRSLAIHYVGAGDRICARDPGGRVRVPDKGRAPRPWKRAKKWLRGRLEVPWRSTKKRREYP